MTHATARTAALLAGLLVLLGRGTPGPSDLAVAGGVALTAYGALTLGVTAVRHLVAPPPKPTPSPIPEPPTSD